MRIHPKEIESVLKLDSQERYIHFIKVVADSREVWSLRSDDGWAAGGAKLSDGREVDYFPVWPRQEYADICSEYYGGNARSMSLDYFMDVFCVGLSEEGAQIGVFPTPKIDPVVIECSPLVGGLRSYIREWYE